MAQGIVLVVRRLEVGNGRGLDALGHALGTQEGVEVAVFADPELRRMGVVIVLGMGFGVVDVAVRVVVPFVKGARVLDQLADQVITGLFQHPVHFHDLYTGGRHILEPLPRKAGEVDFPDPG